MKIIKDKNKRENKNENKKEKDGSSNKPLKKIKSFIRPNKKKDKKKNEKINDKKKNERNKDNRKDIPHLTFDQMCNIKGENKENSGVDSERDDIENYLKNAMISLKINSSDSILTYLDPNEKLHVKKIIKYKEIKHYVKGEKIGSGSFGTVREFVDKRTLKRIAGKIIKLERIAKLGANFKANIHNEYKLVRKLNHINIMKMIDTYKTETKIYLFMEFCIACLKEILDSAPDNKLPKWQSHRYFCHITEGLEYLHSKGIIHRDIKPDNLLIDNTDTIKIADFGVAYIMKPFDINDNISEYAGTRYFQPPELRDISVYLYSGSKFDIWSSGVTLFLMITGKYPFPKPDWDHVVEDEVEYPDMIKFDILLLNLFEGVFKKNYKQRLTIREIKNHDWYIMHHIRVEEEVRIPKQSEFYSDIYRSMNVLARLETKYYPQTDPKSGPEYVTEKEHEESKKVKSPNIRSNRSLEKSRVTYKKAVTSRRVLFGL